MAAALGETEAIMRECAELGIKYAWMHRAAGVDSVSTQAAIYGRERGITVIDGGCPLMFGPASDAGHKLMRFIDWAVAFLGRASADGQDPPARSYRSSGCAPSESSGTCWCSGYPAGTKRQRQIPNPNHVRTTPVPGVIVNDIS